jgi:hypothetical protein
MRLDEECHGNMDRTQVEVAWSMGAQVLRNKRDEGNGGMTCGREEDRCAVVKGRKEAGDVTGE